MLYYIWGIRYTLIIWCIPDYTKVRAYMHVYKLYNYSGMFHKKTDVTKIVNSNYWQSN